MVRISPYAQLANIIIFAASALFVKNFFIPGVQVILIIFSVALFGIRYNSRIFTFMFPLTPIIFFILILNSFHGGGEILLRVGPLVLMKQGIMHGIYYSIFILELFFMSRALTDSFPNEEFISTLYTIDTVFFHLFRKKTDANRNCENGIIIVLFYITKIFYNSYSQVKIFFKSRASLKDKTVSFFREAFFRSLDEFEREPECKLHIVAMMPGDILYILLQIFCIVPAFLLPALHI